MLKFDFNIYPICHFNANRPGSNINTYKSTSCYNIDMYLRAKLYQIDSLELPQWEGERSIGLFLSKKNEEIIKIEINTVLTLLILSF
jgi:hypothetical protein